MTNKGAGKCNSDMCNMFIILIFPTGIDIPIFLVLCFWFLAPVWRFIFPCLFLLIALFFGLMYGLRIMFSGGIDCVEDLGVILSACLFAFLGQGMFGGEEFYQWCRASIDELMLSSGWHDHEVPSFDILVFAPDCGFAGTGGES